MNLPQNKTKISVDDIAAPVGEISKVATEETNAEIENFTTQQCDISPTKGRILMWEKRIVDLSLEVGKLKESNEMHHELEKKNIGRMADLRARYEGLQGSYVRSSRLTSVISCLIAVAGAVLAFSSHMKNADNKQVMDFLFIGSFCAFIVLEFWLFTSINYPSFKPKPLITSDSDIPGRS